jgi:hypothetical protein
MAQFTEYDVRMLLVTSPDANASPMARDTALVKSLVKVFNASLEFAKAPPKGGGELTVALSKKAFALSGVAASATGSKELKVANMMATQTLKSIGLTKIAGMTPAKATAYITIVTAEKIVSAAGLGAIDKCRIAVASLAATTGAGALTCFASGAFTLGIGCVAGAIAVTADAFDVYGQCYAK